MNEQGTSSEITPVSKSKQMTATLEPVRRRKVVGKNWSHLISERVTLDFEYSIYNFDFRKYHGSPVEYTSEITFSAQEIPESHWMLGLINRGSNESLTIKLHLYKESDKKGVEQKLSSQIQVEIAILNKNREKRFPRQYFFPFQAQAPLSLNYLNLNYYGEEIADLLPNGNLTISCSIESLTERKYVGGHSKQIPYDQISGRDQLINHLEDLFETKKLSDVIFAVRGSTFQSHKCILGARSPVFAAMFEHETEEKLTDKVEIEDVEPEVFQEVLRFIYTGQVCPERMQEFGTKLLAAADKYLLENLKQLCEEYLVNHLTAENCLELLIFTDLHSLDYLRQSALDYLRHHMTEVRKTKSWREIKQNTPLWLCEIQEMILDLPTILRSIV